MSIIIRRRRRRKTMSVIPKINCRVQLMHVIIVGLTLFFGNVTVARGGWLDKGADVLKSLVGTT
jgi:hypothetical protein